MNKNIKSASNQLRLQLRPTQKRDDDEDRTRTHLHELRFHGSALGQHLIVVVGGAPVDVGTALPVAAGRIMPEQVGPHVRAQVVFGAVVVHVACQLVQGAQLFADTES